MRMWAASLAECRERATLPISLTTALLLSGQVLRDAHRLPRQSCHDRDDNSHEYRSEAHSCDEESYWVHVVTSEAVRNTVLLCETVQPAIRFRVAQSSCGKLSGRLLARHPRSLIDQRISSVKSSSLRALGVHSLWALCPDGTTNAS
jgi:hypothetical protein